MEINPLLNRSSKLNGRTGYYFDNPTSPTNRPDWHNRYFPDFGCPLTPDDLRYNVGFGNDFTASVDNTTMTDENLWYFIDNAIGIVERSLNIDILPKIRLYADPINPNTGESIERQPPPKDENGQYIKSDTYLTGTIPIKLQQYLDQMNQYQKNTRVVREPGYPYREANSKQYLFTLWRGRPTIQIFSAQILDPIQTGLVNIFPFRQDFLGLNGYSNFFPSQLTSSLFVLGGRTPQIYQFKYPFKDFPQAIFADYMSGYLFADQVPKDLINIIRIIAGIYLLDDVGDGILGPIASSSANLNSISESFGTTLSATSATFGARIKQWEGMLKNFMKLDAPKYDRVVIGIL
jgi:hypothetical protein